MPRRTKLKQDRIRIWLRLLKATRAIETELKQHLRDGSGMSLARFDVMVALSRHPGGLKMTMLSSNLLITNGNATAIVERLAADGLVERFADPSDKRAIVARLTDAGVVEFEALSEMHDACVDRLLARLDADDTDQMLALFAKLSLTWPRKATPTNRVSASNGTRAR